MLCTKAEGLLGGKNIPEAHSQTEVATQSFYQPKIKTFIKGS